MSVEEYNGSHRQNVFDDASDDIFIDEMENKIDVSAESAALGHLAMN